MSKLLLSRGSNKRPRHSRDRHSRPFFSASQARPYTSDVPSQRLALNNGPGLRDFIASNSLAGTGSVSSVAEDGVEEVPYTSVEDIAGRGRKGERLVVVGGVSSGGAWPVRGAARLASVHVGHVHVRLRGWGLGGTGNMVAMTCARIFVLHTAI